MVLILLFIIGMMYGVREGVKKAKMSSDGRNQNVEKEEISQQEIEENPNEVVKALALFEEKYQNAEELLSQMTLEEKVGQLFLARYPGGESALQEVNKIAPAGYVLFGRDFKNQTKESLIGELQTLQNASKTKLLLAVDEEGGTVVRVSAYSQFRNTPFLAPQKFDSLEALLEEAKEKDTLLKELGINMNLAPVVDITDNQNAFIYDRTYGKNAKDTAEYAKAVITQMNQDEVLSCMKHFPGYGDNVDTHTGIAHDKRLLEEFQENDFLPFMAGIETKAPAILVNHNIVECMDETMPATLSPKVHEVLRNDLGFSGVIVTDDLAMDAVKSYVENGEAAVQAVLAGNDLIITSSFEKHRAEVVKAVEEGRISEEMIDMAARRVLAMKLQYHI